MNKDIIQILSYLSKMEYYLDFIFCYGQYIQFYITKTKLLIFTSFLFQNCKMFLVPQIICHFLKTKKPKTHTNTHTPLSKSIQIIMNVSLYWFWVVKIHETLSNIYLSLNNQFRCNFMSAGPKAVPGHRRYSNIREWRNTSHLLSEVLSPVWKPFTLDNSVFFIKSLPFLDSNCTITTCWNVSFRLRKKN